MIGLTMSKGGKILNEWKIGVNENFMFEFYLVVLNESKLLVYIFCLTIAVQSNLL